jgi:hypothetical protein
MFRTNIWNFQEVEDHETLIAHQHRLKVHHHERMFTAYRQLSHDKFVTIASSSLELDGVRISHYSRQLSKHI